MHKNIPDTFSWMVPEVNTLPDQKTVTAQSVKKCGPQNDHMERSDLAKRFFITRWERERAESQEREGERGRGLNTPQRDSA
jgi:hypothetical protein